MGLIYADKVKEQVKLYFNKFARDGLKTEIIERAISDITEVVDDVPTVDIVHCKDCKYWEYDVDTDVGFCVRTEDCDWSADDFCSRGERKDG